MSRKIYLATSWRNGNQELVLSLLRTAGHEVYDFKNPEPGNTGFAWEQVDPEFQEWDRLQYRQGLYHEAAEKGFGLDFAAMQWADTCVLLLPCGASAHTEAGWMKGAGKQVFALIPNDSERPELMYKMFDGICCDFQELLHQLKNEREDDRCKL